ncbi:MAG: CocE/NonD family hydrolase [Stenotrophobium sp.]
MKIVPIIFTLSLAAVGLVGCGRSSTPAGVSLTGNPNLPGTSCAKPAPASTMDATVTVNVPSDFDPTANPTPTTVVPFTVLMPQRCPSETFPLILYGHGFGGSRIKTIDDGIIDDDHAKPLLDRGYVVISFDERGHGDNRPPKGGGFARLMDPKAETQDARAILDWAYDHAAEISVQTEPDSGIAKDLKVGTLGGSYGGMFQWPLAALDPRIDVIAPDRSPHDLLYSLLPGDAVKGWFRLFSLLIQADQVTTLRGTPFGDSVTATPLARSVANLVGPLAPTAALVRTRADLVMFAAAGVPRPVTEQEVQEFTYTHSMDYFESQQAAGKPWGFGESSAKLRPVPALFTQGQRDNLFNVTEAYWNARYFAATGADVRVLTHEDGHMNPFAGQARGLWACGKYDVQSAILAWFDYYLKGVDSDTFRAIPKLCISLLDSSDKTAKPVGVTLESFPVGSLGGAGAVPAIAPTLNASVPAGSGTKPVFVPIVTIQGNDKVLAGIPRIARLTVAPGTGSVQTAIAIVGVGVQRAGQTMLVDQQVTAFVAGDHDSNRGVLHPGEGVLLPGVGEQLKDGDQVGLLFYELHAQYAPIVSTQDVGGLFGMPQLSQAALPNPYDVTATGVELPILVPGQYPGSELSQ